VVIAGRNNTKAQSALLQLRAIGGQAEFVELDVLQEASCKQAIEWAIEQFGRLDILVNNAGTNVRKQPQDLTVEGTPISPVPFFAHRWLIRIWSAPAAGVADSHSAEL
jgi:NAD(P)-dependent dehydrogenase (short-subunit alcohol dehydrogenase family)